MPDDAAPDGGRGSRDPSARERPDAWQVALKVLAVRARTTHEVRQALTRRGYPPDEVAAVIARLTAARYLDDADFARSWVSARARRVFRISAETSTGLFTPAAVRSCTMPGASTKSYGAFSIWSMSRRPRPMNRLTETIVFFGSTAWLACAAVPTSQPPSRR